MPPRSLCQRHSAVPPFSSGDRLGHAKLPAICPTLDVRPLHLDHPSQPLAPAGYPAAPYIVRHCSLILQSTHLRRQQEHVAHVCVQAAWRRDRTCKCDSCLGAGRVWFACFLPPVILHCSRRSSTPCLRSVPLPSRCQLHAGDRPCSLLTLALSHPSEST